jgi:hypothetical protein
MNLAFVIAGRPSQQAAIAFEQRDLDAAFGQQQRNAAALKSTAQNCDAHDDPSSLTRDPGIRRRPKRVEERSDGGRMNRETPVYRKTQPHVCTRQFVITSPASIVSNYHPAHVPPSSSDAGRRCARGRCFLEDAVSRSIVAPPRKLAEEQVSDQAAIADRRGDGPPHAPASARFRSW